MATTQIAYGRSEEGWLEYQKFICKLIDENNLKRICDVGGGANPLLNEDQITERGASYAILDISDSELAKAPGTYQKIPADISSAHLDVGTQFDLIFSRMLAEHIQDAEQFHKNVLALLREGGLAVHFFPTLYALPYLINYLIPEKLSHSLLHWFAPRDRYQNAKFPAYYKWCRGPLKSQIEKFRKLGYDVIEYRGYFGHHGYYQKMGILQKLHRLKTEYLLDNPNPFFTSYAYVVLRKAPGKQRT